MSVVCLTYKTTVSTYTGNECLSLLHGCMGNLLFTFQGLISSEECYEREDFNSNPTLCSCRTFHRMTQYDCACFTDSPFLTDCVQIIAFAMPSDVVV